MRIFSSGTFICFRLKEQDIELAVMRVAEPIKRYWSDLHNLDFDKMSDASEYKEQHRLAMVNWSIDVRSKSYGYLCYEAIRLAEGENRYTYRYICLYIFTKPQNTQNCRK
jgi:phosphomevalonate kinase